MPNQVNGAFPTRALSGTELSRVPTEFRLRPPERINQNPLESNYKGRPHLYECIFDESKDDYTDSFRLAPVDSQTSQLAMEDWAIWKRWELAFHTSKVDFSTHPALPNESERKTELKNILQKCW
jgi:hypothetical protein